MILFVIDQVAGAEYLLPLLRRWQAHNIPNRHIVASPLSSRILRNANIPHTEVDTVGPERAHAILDRFAPRLLVLSASGLSVLEQEMVLAARRKGVHSVQFIDNWVNYSGRFRTVIGGFDGTWLWPDRILTIDQFARDEMIREGVPEDRIVIVGQPWFEQLFDSRANCAPHSGGPLQGVILTQPVTRHYGQQLGYDEHTFTRAALDSWQAAGYAWEHLHLLVHPAEPEAPYHALAGTCSPGIRVRRGKNLDLTQYGFIFGMFSSLMITALVSGVPMASLQPGAVGRDHCMLSLRGLIPRITTVAAMAAYLRQLEEGKIATAYQGGMLKDSLLGSLQRVERFLHTEST